MNWRQVVSENCSRSSQGHGVHRLNQSGDGADFMTFRNEKIAQASTHVLSKGVADITMHVSALGLSVWIAAKARLRLLLIS
ncbi:unnamed protein product [Fusarium graminearum]|uniref:Uncharacterized protein n=1 Tax=Gibberella zeae TaxID=5518 RepID=A0A4E9D992_GIBZA|nr:unnamed protein product [Fusarium graminearum]CAG1966649.1 unnamed protein product [Fusarium graminearum]CAG1978614.1 unnamed protein product [Fusarium graminearum]